MNNKKFTAYRLNTGEIFCGGSSFDPEALINPKTDGILFDKVFSTGWIDNGAHYEKPPQPSLNHIFNWQTKQWEDPRTPAQIAADLESAIVKATQARLDAFARTRNYDGILSAATYATSAVPKFATEGQYCVAARDSTWAALYIILTEVQSGTRPMPTGYTDIEPLLPNLDWPN